MNNQRWRRLRKYFIFLTAIIGISIPIICYMLLPNINILLEPLSKFGINEKTKFLWNTSLVIMSILLYITNDNLREDIGPNISKFQFNFLNIVNIISSLGLCLTGLVDMHQGLMHLSFASIFFIAYTSYIFWWGFLNIKIDFKKAIYSMGTAILIILSSVIAIYSMVFGFGVFEVIFMSLIITWNLKINNITYR